MTDEEMKNRMVYVLQAEANSINHLLQTLDYGLMAEAARLISDCKRRGGRLITTACGTSAMAARKIAHTMCCIGIPSLFLIPSDAVHGSLGVIQPGDIVIMISKGGNTPELTCLIASIKTKKSKIIGVGENPESAIGIGSDLFIKVHVDKEPDPYNMLATASTVGVIAVFDAIAITLMEYTGYTKEQFAIIHPSGAVGERLLKGENK